MGTQVHLKLYESERAVFRAACQIYSSYVAAGLAQPGEESEKQYMERAIQSAISMARRVDGLVQSDAEMPGFLQS